MSESLDLRAVEALLRDLRAETPTAATDVDAEDAAVAIEALLAHARALRAELELSRQAIEILRDIWMQDFGGHGLPNLAQHRIERAAAVLGAAQDGPA